MAHEIDGASGEIDYGSAAALDDLAVGSAFSVHVRYNADTTGGGGTGRIVDKRAVGGGGGPGGWLFFADPIASLGFQTIGGGPAVKAHQRGADNACPLNVWHSVVLTYDDNGDRKGHIYVDGVEISYVIDIAAAGPNGSDADGSLRLGNNLEGDRTFDGELAEAAIWNRVITAGEIAALAAAFSPVFFLNGLILQPPLARSETDRMGNGGTATNTVVTAHPRVYYPSRPRSIAPPAPTWIEHGFALEPDEQTQGAGFAPGLTVAASKFVPGGTYLLMVTARVNGNVGPPEIYEFRTTRGGVEMLGSLTASLYQFTQAELKDHYSYMTVFTAVAGEDIAFELQHPAGGNLAQADEIAIFWMRLDVNLQSTDWYFNEVDDSTAPPALPGAFGDFASITFNSELSEDWLVLSHLSAAYGVPSDVIASRINRDADAEIAPSQSRRSAMSGGAVDDDMAWLLSRVFTLSAASHTLKAQARETDAAPPGSGTSTHHSSRIFALRLGAFRQHGFFWNEAGVSRIGLVWNDLANVSLTPPASTKYLLLGEAIQDPDGAFNNTGGRLRLDGVTVGQGEDNFPTQAISYETADENPIVTMALENLSATLHAVLMQHIELQATGEVEDRSLLVLSMELALHISPPLIDDGSVSIRKAQDASVSIGEAVDDSVSIRETEDATV